MQKQFQGKWNDPLGDTRLRQHENMTNLALKSVPFLVNVFESLARARGIGISTP